MLSGVLADFLSQLIAIGEGGRRSKRAEELGLKIERHILRGNIRVDNNELGYPVFTYRPDEWKADDLPLIRSSSMVSELAPVVLYLRHWVDPNDVLIIEEPEAHLHPGKQTDLARELVRIVQTGVRVVVTTHSEWLLEQLGNLTQLSNLPTDRREGIEEAELALDPKKIGVWLFRPNQEQGGTTVEEVTLDPESGLFPTGYEEIGRALYNQSARIFNRTEP